MSTSLQESRVSSDPSDLRRYFNQFLGKPYSPGGYGPETYSCFGLAAKIYFDRGIVDIRADAESSTKVLRFFHEHFEVVDGDPEVFDLLYWEPSGRHPRGHLGVLITDRYVIEANEITGVCAFTFSSAHKRGEFSVRRYRC